MLIITYYKYLSMLFQLVKEKTQKEEVDLSNFEKK